MKIKMNKKMLVVILSICFVGVVIAVSVINIDKDVELSKEQKLALASINLEDYTVKDYIVGEEEMIRCLNEEYCFDVYDEEMNETYQVCENVLNTCNSFKTYWINCSSYNEDEMDCLEITKVYYTEQELLNILNEWEKQRIELIANAKISRSQRAEAELSREGTTTVK